MDSSVDRAAPRERDFLEELQRQRDEVADDGAYPIDARPATPHDDEAAAVVAAPRVERSVGESSAGQAAGDDLRRRRPGDPELPPPEVSRAGAVPAVDR